MASIESILAAHLAGTTAVTNIVGTRIYPMIAPQPAVFPYIVYQVVGGNEHIVKPSVSTFRFVRKLVQVDCYVKGDSKYAAIKNLEAAVKGAVYAFNSSVNAAILEARIVDTVDEQEANEGIFRVSIDVSILFNE